MQQGLSDLTTVCQNYRAEYYARIGQRISGGLSDENARYSEAAVRAETAYQS